ncbi:MAG: endonuclease V, partial [Candidatus Hodarchaeales archaeon]
MNIDKENLLKLQIRHSSLVSEIDDYSESECILAITVKQINSKLRSIGLLYNSRIRLRINYWISETFPAYHEYEPGFLSLRRKKPVVAAINHFKNKFDVVMIEGAGRQHPRKYGLACEIGVEENIPVIGIIKHPLWGEIDYSNSTEFSDCKSFPVYDGDDRIAYFVRKNNNKSGIFVSVGNNITLDSA